MNVCYPGFSIHWFYPDDCFRFETKISANCNIIRKNNTLTLVTKPMHIWSTHSFTWAAPTTKTTLARTKCSHKKAWKWLQKILIVEYISWSKILKPLSRISNNSKRPWVSIILLLALKIQPSHRWKGWFMREFTERAGGKQSSSEHNSWRQCETAPEPQFKPAAGSRTPTSLRSISEIPAELRRYQWRFGPSFGATTATGTWDTIIARSVNLGRRKCFTLNAVHWSDRHFKYAKMKPPGWRRSGR